MPAAMTGWPTATVPLAHDGSAAQAWSNLGLVASLGLLSAAYGRGVHELWHRRGTGAVVPRWRVAAFAGGVVAILAALTGPPHEWAERSFAGHMTQHMILLVVAGPLLAAGASGLPLALAAPHGLRRAWARWRSAPAGAWARRPGKAVILVAGVHAAVLWAWHLPVLYRLALDSEVIHVTEHASFVVTATLLWSLVLGAPRHRLPGPAAVLLLFATMLPAAALGAALTLAPTPIYGNPLADQQVAGLVMWIPMDVIVLAAALVVVLRWLSQLDRAAPAGRDRLPADAGATRRGSR